MASCKIKIKNKKNVEQSCDDVPIIVHYFLHYELTRLNKRFVGVQQSTVA